MHSITTISYHIFCRCTMSYKICICICICICMYIYIYTHIWQSKERMQKSQGQFQNSDKWRFYPLREYYGGEVCSHCPTAPWSPSMPSRKAATHDIPPGRASYLSYLWQSPFKWKCVLSWCVVDVLFSGFCVSKTCLIHFWWQHESSDRIRSQDYKSPNVLVLSEK